MRSISKLIFATLIVTGSFMTAKADDQSRMALARDVVKNAQVTENMRQTFPVMLNQIKPILAQQGANQETINDLTARLSTRLSSELPKFTDLVAQVYAREFTEEELANLNAFYQSPTGQKMISRQPIIVQFMQTVGQQWGQNIARDVLQDFLKDKMNQSGGKNP